MIRLQTLSSLASIAFFFACDPAHNDTEIKLFDLPLDCLANIRLFDEKFLSGPCHLYCFKMSKIGHMFEKTIQINEMIKKCRLDPSEDLCNYFSYLRDKEKDELCLDLKNWKHLLEEAWVLYSKQREGNAPEESEDLEKNALLEYYSEMYDEMVLRCNFFYKKQIELLKLCGVHLELGNNESNSIKLVKIYNKDVKITELNHRFN